MIVGKTIRVLRISRNISQGEVARELGVSPGYLSLVERDKREPSLGFLKKVASYFRMPVGFLLLDPADLSLLDRNQRRLLNEIRHTLLDYLMFRSDAEKQPKQPRN